MKIAYVAISLSPENERGGVGVKMNSQVKTWREMGHEVVGAWDGGSVHPAGYAEQFAAAHQLPTVFSSLRDMVPAVDCAFIHGCDWDTHVAKAKPFVEAGKAVFVDKPLVDNAADLGQFRRWIVEEGRPILSSSSMRYCKEYMPYRASTHNLGALRYVTITTPKTWERYGIHALEGMYPIVGPGFVSARNTGGIERNVVHLKHARGLDVVVIATGDMYGSFGDLLLCGTKGSAYLKSQDSFFSFKAQLVAFVDYLRSGVYPFPFSETEELMKLVIAGIRSREENGREVALSEIY